MKNKSYKIISNRNNHRNIKLRPNTLLSILLICALFLVLSSCGSQQELRTIDGKEYTSFVPPESGNVGEWIPIDDKNEICIQALELRATEDGSKDLIIRYDWKNNSSKDATLNDNFLLTVYQDGQKLTPDLRSVNDPSRLVTLNKAGETLTDLEQGFIPLSDTALTMQLQGTLTTIFIDGKPAAATQVTVEAPFPN